MVVGQFDRRRDGDAVGDLRERERERERGREGEKKGGLLDFCSMFYSQVTFFMTFFNISALLFLYYYDF